MTTTLEPLGILRPGATRVHLLPSQLPDNLTTPVAWDTETSALYPDEGGVSVVSVAWFADNVQDEAHIRSAVFPFAQGEEGKPGWSGQEVLFGSAEETNLPQAEWDALTAWLLCQDLVAHNGQFDLIMTAAGVMAYRYGTGRGVDLRSRIVWDTMLANHLLWPRHPLALKATSERLWGSAEVDSQRRLKQHLKNNRKRLGTSKQYDLVNWEVMEEYADEDAEKTLRLWLVQVAEFGGDDSPDYKHFKTVLMPVMLLLVAQEQRGMPYAVEGSRKASRRVEEAKKKLGDSLPFLPTGAHAKAYFYGDPTKRNARGNYSLGLEAVVFSEKTGEPSLNAEALLTLVEDDVPWARDWQTYTLLDRAQSMYYDGWADKCGPDNRIRARIRQLGTVSSRFSGERVNLQAMPHDGKLEGLAYVGLADLPTPRHLIRQQVEDTMPGWMIMEYDLSQAELRLGALLANCTAMLEAYANNEDMHGFTATQLGAPRQVGKVANLSLEYGAGWETLGKMMVKMTGGTVRMQPHELREVHAGFHRAYPELSAALHRWNEFAQRKRYVPLVGGQRRHIRPGEDTRLAWNQVVQGSLGQYMLHWLLEGEGLCHRMGIHARAAAEGIGGAGLLMEVHDSMIILLPRDLESEFSRRIKQQGCDLWDDFFGHIRGGVPMEIDGKEFAR